ncbi:MAG: hypothetical protein INR73_18110 [Williamsia sp.]|nr:hypothetical protein [Williamsia sp.]
MFSHQQLIQAIAITLAIAACAHHRTASDIQPFDLIYQYPVVIPVNNKLNYLTLLDTLHVFIQNDCTIYQLQRSRNLQNEKLPDTETYFVYRHNEPTGYLYTASLDTFARLPADSLLKARAFQGLHFEPQPFDRFLSKTVERDLTIEKYFTNHKGAPSHVYDSTYFYYRKSLKTPYSLSKKMDSISSGRLCKVAMIFNETYDPESKELVRKRVLSFEVQDATAQIPEKIKRLFANFREKRRLDVDSEKK